MVSYCRGSRGTRCEQLPEAASGLNGANPQMQLPGGAQTFLCCPYGQLKFAAEVKMVTRMMTLLPLPHLTIVPQEFTCSPAEVWVSVLSWTDTGRIVSVKNLQFTFWTGPTSRF
ncbi:uncharacterized protein ACDP82_010282 isoform 2-T2 [Pangshura tecta]